jgi:hypothetical protein
VANLDTRSKRASSVQIKEPYNLAPPEPTLVFGDIDQADRQHIAWTYSGILAVPPPPGQPVMIRTWGIPTGRGRRDRPGGWN